MHCHAYHVNLLSLDLKICIIIDNHTSLVVYRPFVTCDSLSQPFRSQIVPESNAHIVNRSQYYKTHVSMNR